MAQRSGSKPGFDVHPRWLYAAVAGGVLFAKPADSTCANAYALADGSYRFAVCPGDDIDQMDQGPDRLFLRTSSNMVHAFDAASGRALWSAAAPASIYAPDGADLLVFGERLRTLDAATGAERWSAPGRVNGVVVDPVRLTAAYGSGIRSIDRTTGAVSWSMDTPVGAPRDVLLIGDDVDCLRQY